MTKYNINDIQIIIPTHNRACLLKDAISSILNQTINIKEIIVLDNESTDNTEKVVRSFSDKGVKYIKTFGFLGNFKKAKEIANKKYIILFHDDDILNPNYFETVIDVLNKHIEENISLITTKRILFYNDTVPKIKQTNKKYYFLKCEDFSKYLFYSGVVAYSSAIYKTEYFINTPLEYEVFSKFNDWPFMVKIAKKGYSILLDDSNYYYCRIHGSQDTKLKTNVPYSYQLFNWNEFFYKNLNIKKGKFLEYYFFKIKAVFYFNIKYKYGIKDIIDRNFNYYINFILFKCKIYSIISRIQHFYFFISYKIFKIKTL